MKQTWYWCIIASMMSTSAMAETYDMKVLSVRDGDTIDIEAKYLPAPLKPSLGLRILGVDTPEKAPRAKCAAEAQKGQAATDYTKKVVANARVIQVELKDWDKFGGRVLGDLIIDGKRLSTMLIEANLARSYHGEAKKSWCE